MIELEDPMGDVVEFEPAEIVLVFYSELLSPPSAKGNLIYEGVIRSVATTPTAIVRKIGTEAKMIKLTLPVGGLGSAQGPAWFNVARIGRVSQGPSGAIIKMKGQRGSVQVEENQEHVKELIKAAS